MKSAGNADVAPQSDAGPIMGTLRLLHLLRKRFGALQTLRLAIPQIADQSRLGAICREYLSDVKMRINIAGGSSICIRPFSMDLWSLHEIWDYECYAPRPIRAIADRGVIVDIGANIGIFSAYAVSKLSARRVVCVEPDPANFHLLSMNLSRNTSAETILLRCAVAGDNGQRVLRIDKRNTGGHSLYGQGSRAISVEAITLAYLFERTGVERCDLLKMDCEGAELEILLKAPAELLKRIASMSFEYHLEAYDTREFDGLKQWLIDCGFRLEVTRHTDSLGIVYAVNRDIET